MKAVAFDYVAPRDVGEALSALSGEGAKLLAGGQSLGPMLNLRLVRPQLVVDISRIDALRAMETRGDSLWIGASVTHAQIEDRGEGMLQSVAAGIAYRAVRNRGTIGGSLAHADPAADWPLVLTALGAQIHARGRNGTRTIAAEGFMLGAFTTQLTEDELIEGVAVPRLSDDARWGYYKFCRKTGEFPEASAAVVLDPQRRIANVFLGALNGAPRRCESLARELAQGRGANATAFEQAVAEAAPDLDAIERRMHVAALTRAVRQVLDA